MNLKMIGGMILLFVPVVLLARLWPLLVVLVPLIFLFALVKVYLEVWAEKRQKRRWGSFSVDREFWASPYPVQLRDGAIKLDLTHRWVAFDLHAHETPRCFSAASIRSCRLVGENCVEMTVRGMINPRRAYPDRRDAQRIVEEIEMLRRSPAKIATPQISGVSSPR